MRFQDLDSSNGEISLFAVLVAGGLAGMVCWSVILPIDVLKNRYQAAPEGRYNSLWHVYKHLINNEGASALFRGFGPALLRAFPANAACFIGVEFSKKIFSF